MTVEIPLKAKYRVGGRSRYKSPYAGNNTRKSRNTVAPRVPSATGDQTQAMMVMGPTGKTRMVRSSRLTA